MKNDINFSNVTLIIKDEPATQQKEIIKDENPLITKIVNDEKIRYYLQYPGLQFHLATIYRFLVDPQAAGEVTDEARRAIALKKLKELRIGGDEQNELIEEFCQRILELLES